MQRLTMEHLTQLWRDPRRLRWLFAIAIPLLSIPAWWPLTTAGFPKTHDASVHLMRLFLVDEQIASGAWFPRWLPDLFLGYGYPVLNYYAPSIYYVTELLHGFGVAFLPAFAIMVALGVMGAGWGMYLLAASIFGEQQDGRGEWAGLAAAVAYMYAPYLLVNAYTRGALAELMAQALLPFAFWATYRLMVGQRPLRYAVITTITITALALTHNITLLFLPALLISYVAVIAWQQQSKRELQRERLLWFVGAGGAAMVISAFFWLPVLLERQDLGPSTFDIGKELSIHIWSWRKFLETNWPYDHQRSDIPFRLGLAQFALGLVGLVITGRRSKLWWYWVVWGAICILGITPLAVPLWNTSSYLQLAQFPWRLLTVICLSFAILTGGIVTAFNRRWLQVGTAALIVGIMIVGNLPHRDPYNGSVYADVEVNPAVIARYESVRGAYGAGWHREFLPRWAEAFDEEYTSYPDDAAPEMQVRLVEVAPTSITVATDSPAGGALRLNQFYFPGWEAQLDGVQQLTVEPSTNRGVVTVQVPAGAHTVSFAWGESTVQRVAEWITILGLLGMAVVLWLRRLRWLAGAALVAGVVAAVLLLKTPTAASTPFVAADVEVAPGLRLLGYRVEQSAGGRHLIVTPYWHVTAPLPDMRLQWSLLDEAGQEQSSVEATAYYDSLPFSTLAPGSIVRDGYRLELPWSQPARSYTLQVHPFGGDGEVAAPTPVGNVAVEPTPNITPLHLLLTDLQSSDQAWLDGYTLTINGAPVTPPAAGSPASPPVVRPGDEVSYVLYWRANGQISEDYHSFMHVVDTQRQTLVSLDKVPGTEISRPILWDSFHTDRDTFAFRGPDNAVGGLYYPRIGLYDFSDLDRFQIQSQDGVEIGDGFDMPPLKIVNSAQARPTEKMTARYGDFAELLGYDLLTPGETLHPGDALTLTVYYRSTAPTPVDYTQFFQLYAPGLGMAAQLDQPPLAGGNPTSTWTNGEVIADRVVLKVQPDAASGLYTLNTGFYNPNEGGARIGVSMADGTRYADDQVPLFQVQIEPAQR